jgi:hypothetical protein
MGPINKVVEQASKINYKIYPDTQKRNKKDIKIDENLFK